MLYMSRPIRCSYVCMISDKAWHGFLVKTVFASSNKYVSETFAATRIYLLLAVICWFVIIINLFKKSTNGINNVYLHVLRKAPSCYYYHYYH